MSSSATPLLLLLESPVNSTTTPTISDSHNSPATPLVNEPQTEILDTYLELPPLAHTEQRSDDAKEIEMLGSEIGELQREIRVLRAVLRTTHEAFDEERKMLQAEIAALSALANRNKEVDQLMEDANKHEDDGENKMEVEVDVQGNEQAEWEMVPGEP